MKVKFIFLSYNDGNYVRPDTYTTYNKYEISTVDRKAFRPSSEKVFNLFMTLNLDGLLRLPKVFCAFASHAFSLSPH